MSKETKTIREWFGGLPEPERSLALGYAGGHEATVAGPTLDDCRANLKGALLYGFIWTATREGSGFWHNVFQRVSGKQTPEQAENPLLQALRDALTFVDMATAIQTGVISEPAKALAVRIRALLGEQPSATES